MKTLSKYRECQDCKSQFKLPKNTLRLEQIYLEKNKSLKIFCNMCMSTNIATIEKKQYRG